MEPLQYYILIFFACWIIFAVYVSKIYIYNYLFNRKTKEEEANRVLQQVVAIIIEQEIYKELEKSKKIELERSRKIELEKSLEK